MRHIQERRRWNYIHDGWRKKVRNNDNLHDVREACNKQRKCNIWFKPLAPKYNVATCSLQSALRNLRVSQDPPRRDHFPSHNFELRGKGCTHVNVDVLAVYVWLLRTFFRQQSCDHSSKACPRRLAPSAHRPVKLGNQYLILRFCFSTRTLCPRQLLMHDATRSHF